MFARPIAIVVVPLCLLTSAVLAATFGRSLSVPEYTMELDRLATLANQVHENPRAAAAAIDDLRGDWTVEAAGQHFKIDTGWIIDQFEKLKSNPSDQARDDLIQRLNALKSDAQAFQQPPPESASARAMLAQILVRNEFNNVHGPTWLDRLKYRIAVWILRLLTHAFGSSTVPTVGRLFVWTLVAIAVIALAYFVYRTIKLNARIESVVPEGLPVSAKQWRVWMNEAEAAAAKGNWRDAVHLGYWAGISFLEEGGMWRPDQARTPREYLRLLPAESVHRARLSALTRNLEVTWYGNQTAGPETFSETLSLLAGLGCRPA
jgi:hypothetical protein